MTSIRLEKVVEAVDHGIFHQKLVKDHMSQKELVHVHFQKQFEQRRKWMIHSSVIYVDLSI